MQQHNRYARLSGLAIYALAVGLGAHSAQAEEPACDRIDAANSIKPVQATAQSTGFSFDSFTPQIFGSGTRHCSYLRDESVGGELASIFTETYTSNVGTTKAQIWISKTSGHLLREELAGSITGKGSGHDSVRFSYPKK
jgi:hypothetical protein